MNSQAFAHDINAWIDADFADFVAVTAAGAGDATESNGAWVAIPSGAKSVACYVLYEAVLADTETISIGGNLQDASDSSGTGAADFGTAVASAVLATSSGGTTERGVLKIPANLSGSGSHLRSQVTPDLSASGTDTAQVMTVFVWGGLESV